MKILWITNVELPVPARNFNREVVVGGWMDQSSNILSKCSDIELFILSCCTNYNPITIDGITYIGFSPFGDIAKSISKSLDDICPEIIHIWGSEYIHSNIAVKVAKEKNMLSRVIVSIQGLASIYPRHFFNGVPFFITKSTTFYELLKRNSLDQSYNRMVKQGELEKETFRLVKHCIGRTEWDKACVFQINKNINYYKCNEILRASFYDHKWALSGCVPHLVAFSQAHYPIKGAHFMLEAISIVKRFYPDVKVEILGNPPLEGGLKNNIKCGTYMRYLKKLEKKYNIEDNVRWIGQCNEEQMVSHYLRSNVFVCSSTIENSSNSIGEAMLLGMPIVASDVGGIKSLMVHEQEGLIYQADAPYMLADSIMMLFENQEMAVEMGQRARQRAQITHSREENTNQLRAIYYEMVGIKNEERNKY